MAKPTKLEREIGYTCDVCHGRSAFPSGNTIVHMCEGVLLPIKPSEIMGDIVREAFAIPRDTSGEWREQLQRKLMEDFMNGSIDGMPEQKV